MTPREIQILNRACQMAGIDSSKIRPENPFTKSGGTPSLLQAAVAEIDPQQAARWRVEAGGGLSVATLSEMQSGGDLSRAAMEDLYLHDAEFIADQAKQQQDYETRMLADMEAKSQEMRLQMKTRQLGGNEDRARAELEREALADQQREQQRLDSAKHAQEMQARIHQRQVQSANLAGRVFN